jgi:tetratricopeptide (TPR) repeat protein
VSANPNLSACPEHWQLFELVTEGSTELNAHVKAHVETGCASCNGKLSDILTLERARVMKDEFDAFFDELPADDAPVDEREKFLSQFKRRSRPADRLGRLSFDGRQIAAEIVKLVGEQGIEAAKARLGGIEGDPARGYALLYAAQLAMPKVSSAPALYVELAKALAAASRSLPFLKDKGPAQPVCREQVVGEAQLLESNALNYLGKCAEARLVARAARVSFVEAGEDSFALALADYFEGSAASFEMDERSAWTLLRSAHAEFQLFGQENWAGRAEAALGTLLVNRGKNAAAIRFLDSALSNLHPEQDGSSYAQLLVNRGYALVQIGRLEAAKATYAKALLMTRRLGMSVSVLMIRTGLASIDLASGKLGRALMMFERIGADARALDLPVDVVCSELRIAECLGRMGREQDMLVRVERVRTLPGAESLNHDQALRELFDSVEQRTVSHELLSHVARFVEARDRGVQTAYRPFKLVANGN